MHSSVVFPKTAEQKPFITSELWEHDEGHEGETGRLAKTSTKARPGTFH